MSGWLVFDSLEVVLGGDFAWPRAACAAFGLVIREAPVWKDGGRGTGAISFKPNAGNEMSATQPDTKLLTVSKSVTTLKA